MKTPIFLSALALTTFLTKPIQAQTRLVETVQKSSDDEIIIPYKKYELSNGLTLIVHEDHSDPLVHVDVTYHVGSAREEIGKSGFAHFFEHMMFQGSDNVEDEQHFKIITEVGGTLNGTTNRDRTNYFETVPGNELEKMLWLEADRMGFLLDAVTQEKFEVQRATVKNERGQRYDNVPYGLTREYIAKNLYPYGHPYSWLTIGYVEDLNRVTVDDLKNFFLRWYGPNNAVLTVGGDVEAENVVALVEKYFASIPRGPEVTPLELPLPVLNKDRYVSYTDNYAKLPQLQMVYPTSPVYSKDEAALDCLSEILGQGKNSILYKNFVKTQKAVRASVHNGCSELAGEFTITIIPFPGQSLADMEKLVRQSFDEFEKRGVTEEDLAKFKAQQKARIIRGLERVSGKVSQLAAFETFTGNANYIKTDLERYSSVTADDVMRVYQKYIKGKHAVILSVLTQHSEAVAAATDNYEISKDGYQAPDYDYDELKYVKAVDNFDRSIIPPSGQNPVVEVPHFWTQTEDHNLRFIGTENHEIPLVAIQLRFKGGKMTDAYTPAKAGTANLFAAMMDEDTRNHTAEQFSVELDKLGSSIGIYITDNETVVNVQSLKNNLNHTLKLLEERLLQPKFTEDAFTRNKNQILESIRNAKSRPDFIASTLYPKIFYGFDNVLGWSRFGTLETIENIKLSDIENYYSKYFSRNDAEVIIVGDISKQEILPRLSFLQQLPKHPVTWPELTPVAPVEKTTIYFVDVPGAAQTEFRIGAVTPLTYDALGDFYKATLMNYALGGAFNSRLNLHLRENKGWTYGARSFFSGDKYSSDYVFYAGIKADATDSALTDILEIMHRYTHTGPEQSEWVFTQNSIGQSEARKYETSLQKAAFLARILEYDLPGDYTKKQNDLLKKLSRDEMAQLAKKYLPNEDKLNILLVGDKEKVWNSLQSSSIKLVEIDPQGNPLNTKK